MSEQKNFFIIGKTPCYRRKREVKFTPEQIDRIQLVFSKYETRDVKPRKVTPFSSCIPFKL